MPLTETAPPTTRATKEDRKKNRVIRVEDELWDAAAEQAARDGIPLAEVIRHYLRAYVNQDR